MKKLLFILILFCSIQGFGQIKAYYNLNGNSNDASGNGYNLTNAGSVAYETNIGLAANFTAVNTNKYLYIHNGLGFVYGANNISFSGLFKFKALPTATGILSGHTLFYIQLLSGTVRSFYRITLDQITTGVYKITLWNGAWVSTTISTEINKWYHFAFTCDASGNKVMYMDGNIIWAGTSTVLDSTTKGADVTSSEFSIGAMYYAPSPLTVFNKLSGSVDRYFVNNGVLSVANIKNENLSVKGFF